MMVLPFDPGKMLLFGNGVDLAIAMQRGEKTIVYLMEDYWIRDFSSQVRHEMIDVTSMDSTGRRITTGRLTGVLMLSIISNSEVRVGGEELLARFITVDSLSIEGMFKAIQERIRERD